MRNIRIILFALTLFVCGISLASGAVIPDDAAGILNTESISVGTSEGGDVFETSRNFLFKILTALKIVVSGFALIWIVMTGVYMIVFSENEERVKRQKSQFTYMLIGFLFLNIPGLVYTVFFGDVVGSSSAKDTIGGGEDIAFWDADTLFGAFGFIPQLIGFFEVFIFGVAILTFTWGLFQLMISGGNEEIQKKAKNRLFYGVIALIFLGFAKVWGGVIAKGDFFGEFATIGNKLLGLSLYFAAPVVVFFLVLAAFYMITSSGDEERVKKAKAIFMNTLIASLILLGAYSFVSDLAVVTF